MKQGPSDRVFAGFGTVTEATRETGVAEAVFLEATDEFTRLHFPAGAEALALVRGRGREQRHILPPRTSVPNQPTAFPFRPNDQRHSSAVPLVANRFAGCSFSLLGFIQGG